MIFSKLVTSTSTAVPELVYTSTNNGDTVASGATEQENAITTMVLCNTGTPNITDESVNSVSVSVHLVKKGQAYGADNKIVSELIVPAGESVFFSDEKIILEGGDEIYVGTSSASLLSVTVSSFKVN
jgi:hypothetical protein